MPSFFAQLSIDLFTVVQAHEGLIWAAFIGSVLLLLVFVVCLAIPTPSVEQVVELIERDRSPFADRDGSL